MTRQETIKNTLMFVFGVVLPIVTAHILDGMLF